MKASIRIGALVASLFCPLDHGFASPIVLVPANATWKYLADGSNQGSAWALPGFNDAAWPSGPAQLGFGEGDEATVITSATDPLTRPLTAYFRRQILLSAAMNSATLRLLRDDGAVVYVNGVEVRRDNMPPGPVSFDTLALTAVGGTDETTFFESPMSTTPFVIGTNVIAVELHQSAIASSDLSFALELIADLGSPAPVVTVGAIDNQAREIPPWLDIPEDPAVFRLTRTGSTSNALNVSIRMSGTATNGVDYDLVENTVTIPVGSATADVFIHAIDDSFPEGTETVVLTVVPSACPECYVVNGNSSATASILDNEPANTSPTVNIFSPVEGTKFTAPIDIRLRASANDAEDGYHITVDFYEGSNKIGPAAFLPTLCPSPECPSWELTWSNVPPGNYTLTAKASDTAGAITVSTPVHITVLPSNPPPLATNVTLVSTGSVWKYNDTGTDLGSNWRDPIYDDSTWATGPAQLGYGDGDEATVVSYGPEVANKYVTTWFRRSFQVNDASAISNLALRVLRDDGVVVYLNGIEIYRNNMAPGPVTYTTLASAVAVDENDYLSAPVSSASLVTGANVIAAEIHQANITSSDIGFDLELTGVQTDERSNAPPIITIVTPTNNTVLMPGDTLFLLSSLHDADGAAAHAQVEIFANTESLGLAQLTDPGPLHDAAFRLVSTLTVAGSYTLRAMAIDDRGAIAYSSPVHIRVGPRPPTNQPPQVTIVSPADGANFSSGANPVLNANVWVDPPTDFEGQLATVEFFANDQSIGFANSAPGGTNFGFQWWGIPAGQFTIVAKATDFRGLIGFSEPIHIHVIQSPPPCPAPVQWQTSIGPSGYDEFYQALELPDGGFIAAGESYSSAEEFNYWIVRFNSSGAVQWETRYGGSSGDQLFDLALTTDGGFIAVGASRSPAGPRKAAPLIGEYDFWVVRLDSNGNRLWDRSYGGLSDDFARSVQQTADGGFVVAGESRSEPGGNKTSPHYGDYDVWVIRIDPNGVLLWDKTYGGTGQEFWTKISKTHDGGFILSATTESGIGGNKSSPGFGAIDAWILRIDSDGNKLWDQTFGGSDNDYLGTIIETADGGFISPGWSGSSPSGNKTTPQLGGGDGWVLALNSDGSKRWERSFGGTASDTFHTITATSDGSFVVGGYSFSGAELSKTSPTPGIWLVGIDATGEKLWDTSLPTNLFESIHQTSDGGFVLGGISFDPGPQGWLVKLGPITNCNPDLDQDGVPDSRDDCPGTAPGEIVNARGCSIAQLARCDAPWRNHAEYVRAVIHHAWEFYRHGLITAEQRREIERTAARSDCGRHSTERVCLHLLPMTTDECRAQGVAFLLTGDHTGGCVVQTSTDLEHWTDVMTPEGGITGLELSCPVAHDSATRFYRVRLTP